MVAIQNFNQFYYHSCQFKRIGPLPVWHTIGGTVALLSVLRHCVLIKAIPEGGVNGFIYSLSIMK